MGLAAKGYSAPCPGFSELHSLPSLREIVGKLAGDAENTDEVAQAVNMFSVHVDRFKMLISHMTKSVAQLDTTRCQIEKKKELDIARQEAAQRAAAKAATRAKQRAEAQAAKRAKPSATPVSKDGNLLTLDLGKVGVQIPCHSHEAIAQLSVKDYDRPLLITNVSFLSDGSLLDNDRELRMQFNLFKGGFNFSQPVKKTGRAHGPVQVAYATEKTLTNFVKLSLLPSAGLSTQYKNALLQKHIFGYNDSMRHAGPETYCLDSMRLTLQGTRRVIVCHAADIVEYSTERSACDDTVEGMCMELTPSLALEQFAQVFCAERGIWFGDAGPSSALWVPAGWIVAEMPIGTDTTFGLRASLMRQSVLDIGDTILGMEALRSLYAEEGSSSGHAMADFIRHMISQVAASRFVDAGSHPPGVKEEAMEEGSGAAAVAPAPSTTSEVREAEELRADDADVGAAAAVGGDEAGDERDGQTTTPSEGHEGSNATAPQGESHVATGAMTPPMKGREDQ